MADFLYSSSPFCSSEFELVQQRSLLLSNREAKYYLTGSGCLYFIENHYRGFLSHETIDHFIYVVGAPLLSFTDNEFILSNSSSTGSRLILDRWLSGNLVPHNDLNGPFILFIHTKSTDTIKIYSDLMSFVPLWNSINSPNLLISTLPELIVDHSEFRTNIDTTSLMEFIARGVITYPYSLYTNVKQVAPASVLTVRRNTYSSHNYFHLSSINKNISFSSLSMRLSDSMQAVFDDIYKVSPSLPVACFLSGGEDSRLISSYLSNANNCVAYTMVDAPNQEYSISKKVANTLNLQLQSFKKDFSILTTHSHRLISLIGSSGQYIHGHMVGISSSPDPKSRTFIFGGFAADRLFKGEFVPLSFKIPFVKHFQFPQANSHQNIDLPDFLSSKISSLITQRQLSHQKLLKAFCNNIECVEWMNIWPSSMAIGSSNYGFNRRLFRSLEPFFDTRVALCSISPFSFKLNRRLFFRSFSRIFRKTYFIPHVGGWFPSQGAWFNFFYSFFSAVFYLLKRKLFNKPPRSGWVDWSAYVQSSDFRHFRKSVIDSNILLDLKLSSRSMLNDSNLSHFHLFNLHQCTEIIRPRLDRFHQ